MSKIKKQKLAKKISSIIEFEQLEERLEMNTLSVLACSYQSYKYWDGIQGSGRYNDYA